MFTAATLCLQGLLVGANDAGPTHIVLTVIDDLGKDAHGAANNCTMFRCAEGILLGRPSS